jgi:hypothetical protein
VSRWPLALRVVFDALVFALVLVWIVQPDSPTALFRNAALALIAAALLPLAVRPWRPAWSAGLRRALRLPDLLAFCSVLLVGACELALRAASSFSDSPLLAPPDANAQERIAQWRGRPGAVLNGRPLNALGLPDDDFVLERAPGVRRIVALGDSFAVGVVPYADNFLTLLDERLDAAAPTEVDNFGIVSTGPEDYLYLWRTEARRYAPDLVLVCLFVGNDIRAPRESSLLHRDSLLAFVVPGRIWSLGHQTEGPSAAAATEAGVVPDAPSLDEAAYLAVERNRVELCLREPGKKTRRAWDTTRSILQDLVAEVGPGLRVVLIPDEYQVDDALWASLVRGREAEYDRDDPQRRLLAMFAEWQVPCLDLLPTLRAAQADGPVYAPRDTHWNVAGNRVAAQALAEWLGP